MGICQDMSLTAHQIHQSSDSSSSRSSCSSSSSSASSNCSVVSVPGRDKDFVYVEPASLGPSATNRPLFMVDVYNNFLEDYPLGSPVDLGSPAVNFLKKATMRDFAAVVENLGSVSSGNSRFPEQLIIAIGKQDFCNVFVVLL